MRSPLVLVSLRRRALEPPGLLRHCVAAATVLALGLLLLGCEDPTLGRGITVRNDTDVPLTFEWLLDGEVVTRATPVPPDTTAMLIGAANLGENSRVGEAGCTTVPVVALGPGGEQVARADPPLCVGDEWVVEPSN
jgi:hypothetical protein